MVSSDSFFVDILDSPTASISVTSGDICHLGVLELFSNATGVAPLTYQWAGPNGFMSTLPNPSITNAIVVNNGQYSLTVTSVSGCSFTDTFTVDNILPISDVPSITSNGPICEGEDLILSSSTGGVQFNWVGPLGASDSTFIHNPELVTTSGMTSIPFGNEPYLPGEWSVIVTDANGCTAESPVTNVEINSIPPAEAFNNGPICIGQDVLLSATQVTDAQYEWREVGSTTVISTNQNALISGLTTTTSFELTVISNGCISQPLDTTVVEVHSQPMVTIDPVAPIECTDGTQDLQLNATASNGVTPYFFNWSGPNGFTSTFEDPTLSNINASFSGTYSVSIIDANGCQTAEVSVEIEITDGIPQPVISSTGQTCEDGEVVLSLSLIHI